MARTRVIDGEAAPSLLESSERQQLRSYFVTRLCTRREFLAYWLPSQRRVTLRTPCATKRHALPAEARYLGHYAHPFDADQFIGDLEALLALLEHQRSRVSA